MSEFRELIFILNDIRTEKFDDGTYAHNKSIFNKAKPAILNFPVITTDLISLEDLTMVNKALEREYATVVRLAMGLDDIIDDNGSRPQNKIEYIKKFHTNTYTSDERSFGEFFEESVDFRELNEKNLTISEETEIKEFNKKDIYCEELGLNMNNLNDYTIMNEAKNKNYKKYKKQNTTVNVPQVPVNLRVSTGGSSSNIKFNGYDKQLVDNDIKKSNELIPTTLDITVYHNMDGKPIEDHILLGIKCTSHKVSSEEIIENIYQCLEHKKGFFRFIQWTTGEIKFFKDYLLCLDFLKKEALSTRNKGSKTNWFRTLKNRSTISKIKSSLKLKDTLIPNSTLVITMDEVDYIRNSFNIDLFNDVKSVQKLIDTYFLIGFVIVDAGSEIVHFKFDGFDKYQSFSYRALERENRNTANDIRALTSLMGKF